MSPAALRPSKLMQPLVRVLTMRAEPLALLCLPAVMTSHFSFGAPVQSTRPTGMRFSRKSPAVGSTEMHWPLGARIETALNARVAVSSRWFASAAAEGFSVPPARETGTGSVGLAEIPVATPAPAAVVVVAAPDEDTDDAEVLTTFTREDVSGLAAPRAMSASLLAAAEELATVCPAGGGGAVTVTVLVLLVHEDNDDACTTSAELVPGAWATDCNVDAPEVDREDVPAFATLAVVVAAEEATAPAPAPAPPKVKDWLGSLGLQFATSITLPLTVKQEPGAFAG